MRRDPRLGAYILIASLVLTCALAFAIVKAIA